MLTKVYGASDDLIEIEGEIYEEHDEYDFNGKVEASDGTIANLKYDENGQWKFTIKKEGDKFLELIGAVGDDAEHTSENAVGCTSYSDVLVFKEGIEWIKIGKKKFKR